MVRFTLRASIHIGDVPTDRQVEAPAYLLSPEQAIALGRRLMEAGREMQQELRDVRVP
jgi:hypothetical protein